MSSFDVAVIGGGLIGAAIACQIAHHRATVLLEQESQPGYHASGRSAAILLPPYGGPLARALTAASMEFLARPPASFAASPFTAPRGALFLAREDQRALVARWTHGSASQSPESRVLSAQESVELVPVLNAETISAALWLPDVCDIDAAALLQGFVRSFKTAGGRMLLNSPVLALSRDRGLWNIETPTEVLRAKVIVNAAGAWADQIADLARAPRQGLTCCRRTMLAVDGPTGSGSWPVVSDVAETFYFKPDGSRLLVSPADRTPLPPQDVQPDDLDVAAAVDRFEAATTCTVKRVTHRWAGLRTLSPDEEPIVGFDLTAPDFLWAAGFAGFGVQAAFAAGRCAEALLTQRVLPAELAEHGLDLERLSPARLERSPSGPHAGSHGS